MNDARHAAPSPDTVLPVPPPTPLSPAPDGIHAEPAEQQSAEQQANRKVMAHQEYESEVQEYLATRAQRRHLFPRAVLVGVAAGAIAIAYRAAQLGGDNLRDALYAIAHRFPQYGWLLPMLVSATATGLSLWLVQRFAPEAGGSGIPHLEAVLRGFRTLRGLRVLIIKFIGGMLALGAGLSTGREGPTIQMGAAAADLLASRMKVTPTERRTLLTAGAGSGLAAAFNAPLSGIMFVLEEVQRDFRPIVFGAALVAAACADIIARSFNGQLPVFKVIAYPVPDLTTLPVFLVLGAVAGLFGIVFNTVLLRTLDLFGRIPPKIAALGAAAVGAIVGLVGWFAPGALGGGHHLTEEAMAGHLAFAALPAFFVGRFVLTMISYSSGVPGGIFAPLLGLGAMLGLGVGIIAHSLLPSAVPHPEIFAVVGMAAYFTAIVRAPLTGIVLILEMTGNYGQMLPLVVACFSAYAVAEAGKSLPIYEALLERDLSKGDVHIPDDTTLVREFTVQPGAPFAGKRVMHLGLPPGCIVVSVRDHDREWIPSGTTRLKADDSLTVIIAPEVAQEALTLLQNGCHAHQ